MVKIRNCRKIMLDQIGYKTFMSPRKKISSKKTTTAARSFVNKNDININFNNNISNKYQNHHFT